VKRACIVYDPVFLKHDTGSHPENAQRLEAVVAALESAPFAGQLKWLSPAPAARARIEAVHDPEYVRYIEEQCRSGAHHLDADTVVCPDSWEAAVKAAGAVITAVDTVMAGECAAAFCPVRPPGHHAERSRAMGFCLFNNVAIGAFHARNAHDIARAAIIDFDVHHGNGTQNTFFNDPSVFFISLHQIHNYPGTGWEEETGGPDAPGTIMNFPMIPHSGDDDYLDKFDTHIIPALRIFAPQFIFISAGFDAHRDDPLADIALTERGYAGMTARIVDLADELGHGRVVSVLEGGYDLDALAASACAHVGELLRER